MTSTKKLIKFNVETERILQILSSEIYDSPLAMLRENVQNGYDAILMRCTEEKTQVEDHKISIDINGLVLTIEDDGIGMTEEVLRENFWKAGSSGKKTQLAQESGVIGTFGIGAMANFGVCSELLVESRSVFSSETMISRAARSELKIAEDCVELDSIVDGRSPGTKITATLDESLALTDERIENYLQQYVRYLPVSVTVNGRLISKEDPEQTIVDAGYSSLSIRQISDGTFAGKLETLTNSSGRVIAVLRELTLNGVQLNGQLILTQQGGATMGFREFLWPSAVAAGRALSVWRYCKPWYSSSNGRA